MRQLQKSVPASNRHSRASVNPGTGGFAAAASPLLKSSHLNLCSLTHSIATDKVITMNTTLEIDDARMQRLREEATRRGTTVSALVETGLKHILDGCNKTETDGDSPPPIPSLPKWRGKLLVDISNRDELYRIWDEDASFRY